MTKKLILMLLLVFLVTSYASADSLSTGLVSYWKFDDDTIDSAGGNNGTLEGPAAYVTGKIGKAVACDNSVGPPGWVSLATTTVMETDWSISVWVNLHTADTGGLLSGGDGDTGGGMDVRLCQFGTEDANGAGGDPTTKPGLSNLVSNVNGTWDGDDANTTAYDVPIDVWTHLAFVWRWNGSDPNTAGCQLFADGVNMGRMRFKDVAGTHGNGNPEVDNTLDFVLKYNRIGELDQYDGYGNSVKDIDELAIWNRTLSDADVAALYNGGAGQEITPVLASAPNPADNAPGVDIDADLSWTASDIIGATYDVYFGTVTPAVTKVSPAQAGTTWVLAPLTNDTEYHWRIDVVDSSVPETHTGIPWSFTTVPPIPPTASNPYPADEATDVELNVVLSWDAGVDGGGNPPLSHTIYLDPNETYVTNGDVSVRVSDAHVGTTLDPGAPGELLWDTRYFWRVDENYSGSTANGEVWEFTFATDVDCDRPVGDFTDPTETYNHDCLVNLADFVLLAASWLDCGYQNEDCPPGFTFVPR